MKTKKSITGSTNSVLDASPDRGFIGKRLLLSILLMGAALILFVWGAGGISYGNSAHSVPLKVTASAQFYPTFGTPNDALVTPDNAYVLVSVSEVDPCSNDGCAGVQVFTQTDFINPCGNQQILSFPLPFPGSPPPPPGGPLQAVDGMKFFPGQSYLSVGAAVEAQGAEFFRLASLNEPCAVDGVINVQQPPVFPYCNPQNLCPPGTFNVAVTPDGYYAFVANEYGVLPSPPPNINAGSGTIGIIRTHRDDVGRFTDRTRRIPGSEYIYVPGGSAIPGVTMSHDGNYVYVTSESASADINPETMMPYRDPTNVANSPNGVVLCPGCPKLLNGSCDNKSAGPNATNGLLTVIDVNKAKRGMGQASIVTIIASGCSPVRAVESTNGQYVFVATRGKNTLLPLPPESGASGYQVLVFDRALLLSFPNDALLGYGDTHGTGPVGLALFGPNDSLLAVANGNRYYREPENRRRISPDCKNRNLPPCTANVAIMDVSDPKAPSVQQTVPAYSISSFPRDVTVGPDGSTLYVPNADARVLEVIRTSVK